MDISIFVNQNLVLDDSTFFQIFKLDKSKFLIIKFKNSLWLFRRNCESSEHKCNVFSNSNNHESSQRYGKFDTSEFKFVSIDVISFNRIQSTDLFVVTTTNKNLFIIDSTSCTLRSGNFHAWHWNPFGIVNVKKLASFQLDFVLSVITSERIHSLWMVNCREKVSIGWHLALAKN